MCKSTGIVGLEVCKACSRRHNRSHKGWLQNRQSGNEEGSDSPSCLSRCESVELCFVSVSGEVGRAPGVKGYARDPRGSQ